MTTRIPLVLGLLIPLLGSQFTHSRAQDTAVASSLARGEAIYKAQCADCHGAMGEGVVGAYDRPLVGDLAISQLASEIDKTMPEGDPSACVGEDAKAAAEYIFHTFYSEVAQNRQHPPKPMLSRLTGEQFRQSIKRSLRSKLRSSRPSPIE